MFCILVKEKQLGHEEYVSGVFWGVVRVHTVTIFKKVCQYCRCCVLCHDPLPKTQHETEVHNQLPLSLYMYLYFYQLHYSPNNVSPGMDTYGIEWLFFQRKDHLKTIKKQNKMLQDTSIISFTHVIQNHTCTCEKN